MSGQKICLFLCFRKTFVSLPPVNPNILRMKGGEEDVQMGSLLRIAHLTLTAADKNTAWCTYISTDKLFHKKTRENT